LFVLGTPSVKDPFNPDRWDYVQTFSRRGGDMVMRTVTLHFDNGLLSEIEGQDNPFAPAGGDTGESEEVASFIKPNKSDQQESPQDAAVGSVEEEVLEGVDPDEEAVNERNETDREFQRDMDVLDQTPGNPTAPDIDG
jgi:outer membrane protein assembly factor BamE (lipoprotein component of BamABCDE complex)